MSDASSALGNALFHLGDTLGETLQRRASEKRALEHEQAVRAEEWARQDALRSGEYSRQDELYARQRRDQIIQGLIESGYLAEADRNNPEAVAAANQKSIADAITNREAQQAAVRDEAAGRGRRASEDTRRVKATDDAQADLDYLVEKEEAISAALTEQRKRAADEEAQMAARMDVSNIDPALLEQTMKAINASDPEGIPFTRATPEQLAALRTRAIQEIQTTNLGMAIAERKAKDSRSAHYQLQSLENELRINQQNQNQLIAEFKIARRRKKAESPFAPPPNQDTPSSSYEQALDDELPPSPAMPHDVAAAGRQGLGIVLPTKPVAASPVTPSAPWVGGGDSPVTPSLPDPTAYSALAQAEGANVADAFKVSPTTEKNLTTVPTTQGPLTVIFPENGGTKDDEVNKRLALMYGFPLFNGNADPRRKALNNELTRR